MTRFARIADGLVAEIIEIENGATPADRFHPDLVAAMVPAPEGVASGWTFTDGEFAAPSVAVPTLGQYRDAISAHVDATAQARDYANAISCAGYAASTNAQWAAEAAAFIGWRDAVWSAAYDTLAAVQGGAVPPTVAALVASLPAIEWPE